MVYIPKSKVKLKNFRMYGGRKKSLVSKAPKISGKIGNLLKAYKNK
jgi:hypothetical protein